MREWLGKMDVATVCFFLLEEKIFIQQNKQGQHSRIRFRSYRQQCCKNTCNDYKNFFGQTSVNIQQQ